MKNKKAAKIMIPKKVWKIVIPVSIAAVIGVAAVVNNAASAGKQLAQAMEVEAIAAETGNVKEMVETNGMVVSGVQKTFFSPVNASVETAGFQTGDLVKAGDKLVTFNLKDLEEQNQKAELTAKAGRLGYQDSINKSNEAASRQASARNQAAQLQAQVNVKEQEVQELIQAITAQADAKAASQEQEEKALQAEISNLQKQLRTEEKELSAAKKSYDKAAAKQQTAQVNFEAAAAAAESNPQGLEDARDELNAANQDLTDAKTIYEKEQDAVSSLQKQLEALNTPFVGESLEAKGDTQLQERLQTAQAELAELKGSLESQKAMAEGDSGALSSAAREQMQTNNNLADLESKSIEELIEEGRKGITAEFDGVISDKQVLEGALVSQGMQLFTLQSIEDVNVEVTLSKNVYDKVKEGQKAEITLAGQTYQGTVKKISRIAVSGASGSNQAAVATSSIMALVHIDNPDDNIFLGVDAKVKIQAAEANDVIILPTEAVNIGKDGTFCWVSEDGTLKKRSITTGVTSDDCAEITQGIDLGEMVIPDPGIHEEGDAITIKEKELEEGPSLGAELGEETSADLQKGEEAENSSSDAGTGE